MCLCPTIIMKRILETCYGMICRQNKAKVSYVICNVLKIRDGAMISKVGGLDFEKIFWTKTMA